MKVRSGGCIWDLKWGPNLENCPYEKQTNAISKIPHKMRPEKENNQNPKPCTYPTPKARVKKLYDRGLNK